MDLDKGSVPNLSELPNEHRQIWIWLKSMAFYVSFVGKTIPESSTKTKVTYNKAIGCETPHYGGVFVAYYTVFYILACLSNWYLACDAGVLYLGQPASLD